MAKKIFISLLFRRIITKFVYSSECSLYRKIIDSTCVRIAMDGAVGRFSRNASEFPNEARWLNTDLSLSLAQLKGNIVILDFWTYCCINCMHMLPVLASIEERYAGRPVVVIGVHSAKFENEKNEENIRSAVARYEIRHPVVVDREMRIWRAYGISAWPTLVIVNPNGRVVHREAGETDFETLAATIDYLLSKYSKDRTLSEKKAEIRYRPAETKGTLLYPGKLSFSPDGRLFALSDSNHNRIIIAESETGKITDKIGGPGRGHDDGGFAEARFSRPQGVLWHMPDTVYIADTENHLVRKADLAAGKVSTIAGTGSKSLLPGIFAKGRGRERALNSPWDITSIGDMLYIAMAGSHQIWQYDAGREEISAFAGSGRETLSDGILSAASFAQPSGIFAEGNTLYVADSEASAVRSISVGEGFVSTLVGLGLFVFGSNDGRLPEARMQHPMGISSEDGIVYIADTYNHSVRTIDTKEKMVATLVSAKSESACRFNDPECDRLGLYEPSDVKLKGSKAYIVDTNNHLVRIYDIKKGILQTLDLKE